MGSIVQKIAGGIHKICRTKLARKRFLLGLHIDRDDALCTGEFCARDHIEPNSAGTDHRNRVSGPDFGGVDRCARPRNGSAAQDRSLRKRQLFRYLYELVFMHQRVFGESRGTEHRRHRFTIPGQTLAFFSFAKCFFGMLTLIGVSPKARSAVAAELDKRGDDMIADRKLPDLRPESLDDAGKLMAEDGRQGSAKKVVLRQVQIRMAQPGCPDLDKDLTTFGLIDLDFFNVKFSVDCIEYSCFHGVLLFNFCDPDIGTVRRALLINSVMIWCRGRNAPP
jgi:hypothetical protein